MQSMPREKGQQAQIEKRRWREHPRTSLTREPYKKAFTLAGRCSVIRNRRYVSTGRTEHKDHLPLLRYASSQMTGVRRGTLVPTTYTATHGATHGAVVRHLATQSSRCRAWKTRRDISSAGEGHFKVNALLLLAQTRNSLSAI